MKLELDSGNANGIKKLKIEEMQTSKFPTTLKISPDKFHDLPIKPPLLTSI